MGMSKQTRQYSPKEKDDREIRDNRPITISENEPTHERSISAERWRWEQVYKQATDSCTKARKSTGTTPWKRKEKMKRELISSKYQRGHQCRDDERQRNVLTTKDDEK